MSPAQCCMLMAAGLLTNKKKMPKQAELISKLEFAGLTGRGGAGFPVAKKWLAVKDALANTQASRGYIIVNAAEGEPGVKKDAWLLEHEAEEVLRGVKLAWDFFGRDKIAKIYLYWSKSYQSAFAKHIEVLLAGKNFHSLKGKLEFFLKPKEPSYVCGEESTILNIIEGKRPEPRLRPPFPAEHGLFGAPTLVSNVETFYSVSLVERDKYLEKRFYTLAGAVKHRGVFALPAAMSIEEILRTTDNYPNFDFFVLSGGEVCGEALRSDQLSAPVEGSGLIMVYDAKKTDKKKLLDYWLKFYEQESCGACTACREGSYRLRELFLARKMDSALFNDLLDNLEESSLCSLGSSLPLTVKSFLENIYHK